MFVGGSGRSDKNGLAAGAAASAESNTFITFQIIIFRVDPDGRYSQRAERSGEGGEGGYLCVDRPASFFVPRRGGGAQLAAST